MHKAGSIYFIEGTYNLLSQLQIGGIDHAVLISLDGYGNRWVDPIQVADFRYITDSEMQKIAGDKPYELHKGQFVLNKH